MRGWFRRGWLIALTACVLSLPLLPVSFTFATALGPEPIDVRRGGIYQIDTTIPASCDVDPAQDLELEWNGKRISWESLQITPAAEKAWKVTGVYRVPGEAELGYLQGPEVFCWDLEQRMRTSVYSLKPGGVVTYDASVTPVDITAGSPVTVEGFVLPTFCGGPEDWQKRLSIRFDGEPVSWTSITGSIDKQGHSSVTAEMPTPGEAMPGQHEWSIWCLDWNPDAGFARIWERTIQVTAAPPPTTPPSPPPVSTPSPPAVVPPVAQGTGTGQPEPSPTVTPSPSKTSGPSVAPSAPATLVTTPPSNADIAWPRAKVVSAIPRLGDLNWPSPWTLGVLLILAVLLFLLIGFPSELFNQTFQDNEPTIRQWLHLPPKRHRKPHRVGWPMVALFVMGSAALMAVAEPSPIFSRETLITVLALAVAIPATALVYEFVLERHARRSGQTRVAGDLAPVYPAIVVAVICALLSRFLHFVPAYVYGLVVGYTAIAARSMSHRDEGAGVLKATGAMFFVAVLSWFAWQVWVADAATTSAGFMMRWLDTTLVYIALLGLQAPLLALMPMRFMDGQSLWRWSKALWLMVYCTCMTVFLLVLMDFESANSDWSAVIAMAILFVSFGLVSVSFWAFFAIRARRQTGRATVDLSLRSEFGRDSTGTPRLGQLGTDDPLGHY